MEAQFPDLDPVTARMMSDLDGMSSAEMLRMGAWEQKGLHYRLFEAKHVAAEAAGQLFSATRLACRQVLDSAQNAAETSKRLLKDAAYLAGFDICSKLDAPDLASFSELQIPGKPTLHVLPGGKGVAKVLHEKSLLRRAASVAAGFFSF
jgi:hypothetical protein